MIIATTVPALITQLSDCYRGELYACEKEQRSTNLGKNTSYDPGIGVCRLRMLAEKPNSNLIIWVGSKKMFKRKKLDEYLENSISI